MTPWTVVLPGSSVHGISQARRLEWVAFPSSGDLPDLGMEPESPALQAVSSLLSHRATDSSLAGKSHGQRSLTGYSPWGHKKVGHDLATEQQQKYFMYCSLLLKPRINIGTILVS